MNLFKVHSDEEWQNALTSTHEQGRVALMIRTPKCNFNRDQAIEKIIANMGLSQDDHQEVNLRELYNAVSKAEDQTQFKLDQKASINQQVRKSLTSNQLLLLNVDDFETEESMANNSNAKQPINSQKSIDSAGTPKSKISM